MNAVAEDVVDVLALHYSRGGYAPLGGFKASARRGQWWCSCGAGGDVPNGEYIIAHHRRHVAEVVAETVGRRLAEAWRQGSSAGWEAGVSDATEDEPAPLPPNPYRVSRD